MRDIVIACCIISPEIEQGIETDMSKLTQMALASALTTLLEKKPLDKITIKELTDACGVTRNTFYYHFQDIYDLLSWIFVQKSEDIISHCKEEKDWKSGFMEGLCYLYDNRAMIYHVYQSISREVLDNYLYHVVNGYALDIVQMQAQKIEPHHWISGAAIKLTADFFRNAVLGSMIQWIREDMKTPPGQLAAQWDGMFRGTVGEALLSAQRIVKQR